MESMITFAKGPLFAFTFGIMILGLVRLVMLQLYSLAVGKGRRLQNAPWRKILGEAVTWIFPFPHFIKGTILFSSASFVFHIGVIIVPLFLADHIVLWEGVLKVNLPAINHGLADFLTLTTLACLMILLGFRIFSRRHRAVSHPSDYYLLVLIMLTLAAGFMASHPRLNPFRWDLVMLIHLLSAEMLFLCIPTTKLAHVVLFAFDRISEVHWQLRPGAGEKVAEALFGEKARV
jgi:nitrate reductase gamma subunit